MARRVSCTSGTALLLGCMLVIWAAYLHVMQDSQIEVVHAALRGVRSDLSATNMQLQQATAEIARLQAQGASITSQPAVNGNVEQYQPAQHTSEQSPDPPLYPSSRRVHALRRMHPNPKPLPPLAMADTKHASQVEFQRKRAGYGGDASDGAHIGGWKHNDTQGWEPNVWNWLIDIQKVNTFMDIGCGAGIVTKYFLDRGVDARCVEASNEAINHSFVPRDRIIQHDFTRGPWYPKETVDVMYTVEFLEHVDQQYLDNVVALMKSARYIVMSASKMGGWSHVNVHFKWWWIEIMESYGFKYSPRLTEVVLQGLVLKGFPRSYAYMQFTGLVFRNPEVDFENMWKEPADMVSRKKLWAKHSKYLKDCACF